MRPTHSWYNAFKSKNSSHIFSQRVRKAPLKKPDRMLRNHSLKVLESAVPVLQSVLLFHPQVLVLDLPDIWCICGNTGRIEVDETKEVVQCGRCYEWFHQEHISLPEGVDLKSFEFSCEWCLDTPTRRAISDGKVSEDSPRRDT